MSEAPHEPQKGLPLAAAPQEEQKAEVTPLYRPALSRLKWVHSPEAPRAHVLPLEHPLCRRSSRGSLRFGRQPLVLALIFLDPRKLSRRESRAGCGLWP